MTLLQLEYFCRLAETEHITHTAKQLCISQTALSNMIIGLEKELGVQLFDRSSRTIRLNSAGDLYLKYVTDALHTLNLGQVALNNYTQAAEKRVRIAVGTPMVWGPLLYDFQKKYPQYVVNQNTITTANIRNILQAMEVDFVIAGTDDIHSPDLVHEVIKQDNLYLCVPEMHPLALQKSVYLSELKDEPFISLPDDTPWQAYCDNLLHSAGLSIKPVLTCDYSLRSNLIKSGFGVALTSSSAMEVDLLRPNYYVQIKDEFARRDMALFWNPKQYMTRASIDFLEFCLPYYKKAE